MTTTHEEDLLRMSMHDVPPSPSFETHKSAGNTSFHAGDYREAIRHYTAAEDADPLSPVPPANRAMAHLKLSQWTHAKADAAVALELHDALPETRRSTRLRVKILLRSAAANFNIRNYEQAAMYCRQVLEDDPRNPDAREKLHEIRRVAPAAAESTRHDAAEGKITLLSSSSSAPNGNHAPIPSSVRATPSHAPQTPPAQPLHTLPTSVMSTLVSRWTSTPPTSAFEFERAWNALATDDLARASFLLHTVGPTRLAEGLLGETLTPHLLEHVIRVLSIAVGTADADPRQVADLLSALTKVARFDLLLMFWGTPEKQPVLKLIQTLEHRGAPRDTIVALRERYS